MADVNCTTKACTKCGIEKPRTSEYFFRHKGMSDGLRPDCKQCQNKVHEDWRNRNRLRVRAMNNASYERHKETRSAHTNEYQKAHPEKGRERTRRWREKHREILRIRQRQHYHEHRDEILMYCHQWRKDNPDLWRSYYRNYRAKKMAGGSHSGAEIALQYKSQKGKCWHCGKPVGENYHADHLTPVSKGGSNNANNIVISCEFCNLSKGAKMTWEWNGRLL